MKIVTVLGARPQFIKASSISREFQNHKSIQEVILHTGQHYDFNMNDIFFEQMQIPMPNYFLGINRKSQGAMTGQMINKVEEVLIKEKPDLVLVYGDTNSTLAGAIAASKLHIKIAHVEAGLRSFNIKMPEEVNRILTDRISSYLFCPTRVALNNLINEGVVNWKTNAKTFLVGDVMLDGALFYKKFAKKPKIINVAKNFILCTVHRAENTNNTTRLKEILSALNLIAKKSQVILPLHPRTKAIINKGKYETSNLTIIDPIGFLNMLWLVENCSMVMTDSGGLQKEAYFSSKLCITLRDETEWVELVKSQCNILVGANKLKILEAYENNMYFKKDIFRHNHFGNGEASKLIVSNLLNT